MEDATQLPPLSAQALCGPVGHALGDAAVEIVDWQASPLGGGYGFLAHLCRVSGQARCGGLLVPWSLILKIALPPADESVLPGGGALPETANWRREFLVYTSGLLRSLPAEFTAPQCYGTEDRGAGGLWLFLEDVGELSADGWSVERVQEVAHQVGTFNGRYGAGPTLPAAPWLCTAWLRKWVTSVAPAVDAAWPAVLAHPVAGRLFPAEHVARYARRWPERATLLATLDRLPQTFCHNDLNRRNLFVRRAASGATQTVAIDWEDAGLSAVGEDLALLVMSSLKTDADARARPDVLDAHAFAGYLAGLQAAGWEGDPRHVRFAYTVHASLRTITLTRWWAQGFWGESLTPNLLADFHGCPIEEAFARENQLMAVALERLDEAYALLPHLL